MVENIGNVKLDYSKYPGEDFYCDGEVEDEILEIVRKYSPVEYRREIEERKSWPILYHLSPLRENIVEWLPIKNTDKVLEGKRLWCHYRCIGAQSRKCYLCGFIQKEEYD